MSTNNWYYTKNQRIFGPFDGESLRKLNASGSIGPDTMVAREGDPDWRPLRTVDLDEPAARSDSNLLGGIAGTVSQASGLERLEGFSMSRLFSEVFKKHTAEEIEEHFVAGTRNTTPSINEVSAGWPTPWAFVRLLALSIIAAIGFYYALYRFENPLLLPGWIFIGCFGIPFAVLVFFMEVNVPRNISFYRILSLMFLGGLLSLIVSLFLFEYTRLDTVLGAMSAGLVEETAKLSAVIFFTRKWRSYRWTLNGLLLGAAIGTGFSAFETSGYVFVALLQGGEFGSESVMIMRAFFSPFTHTIWTAAAAAALWRVKGDREFSPAMLSDIRFIRIFAMVVLLHMIWNSPLTLPVLGGLIGLVGMKLLLGLIGWLIVLPLIQAGLREIKQEQARTSSSA